MRPLFQIARLGGAVVCVLIAVALGAPSAFAATGSSYWLASSTGQVYAFGTAHNYGSAAGRLRRGQQVVGIESTPDGKGYWLAATSGRDYAFGDARRYHYQRNAFTRFTGRVTLRGLRGHIVGIAKLPQAPQPAPTVTTVTTVTTTVPAATAASAATATPGVTSAAGCTAATTPTSNSVSASGVAQNWAGYVESTTAAFTSVTGSFTVPSLTAGDSLTSALSEWVGVDGFDNQDLIQAGIALYPEGGSNFSVQPWWEVLPAPETPITTLTVSSGDTVDVTLTDNCNGTWNISVADTTTGQTFTITQDYSGPGSSAEWIVEAPATESDGGGYCYLPLAQFSPQVDFSSLATSQTSSALNSLSLVQSPSETQAGCPALSSQTATPSAIDANGFNVAYGSSAPAAP